jgi:hypothetical protein
MPFADKPYIYLTNGLQIRSSGDADFRFMISELRFKIYDLRFMI